MAVKIRLKRIGAKKKPFYRIVVADARYPRDGRFIEQIGTYDPMLNPAKIIVDGSKALHWMKHGAQPTDTVRALLKLSGALEKARKEEEELISSPSDASPDVSSSETLGASTGETPAAHVDPAVEESSIQAGGQEADIAETAAPDDIDGVQADNADAATAETAEADAADSDGAVKLDDADTIATETADSDETDTAEATADAADTTAEDGAPVVADDTPQSGGIL